MNSLRTFICTTLIFAMATGPLAAWGTENGGAAEVSAAQDMARAMGFQEITPPADILELRNGLVGDFFESSLSQNEEPTSEEKSRLISALQKLKGYFTSQDQSGQFDNLIPGTVVPFVQSLTQEKLLRSNRAGLLTNPIAKWTLESLLVKSMVSAFSKSADLSVRATRWVRTDLRGASIKAAVFLGIAAVLAGDHYFFRSYLTYGFVSMALWGFRNQIGNTISNALIGWFITPIQDNSTTWTNRIFGGPQGWLSGLLSRWKPAQKENGDGQTINMDPRIATAEKHGTNFGGQSPADQVKNVDQFRPIFAAHPTRASQLWQSSVSAGKGALIASVWDLQNASSFIYVMDSNLEILGLEAARVLQKYDAIFLADQNIDMNAKRAKIEQLEDLFEKYEALSTATWAKDLDQNQQQQIRQKFEEVKNQMRELTVTERDLNKLWDLQVKRAKAVSAFVTGINAGLFRRKFNAENNMNAFDGFADVEEAHYRGFNIEDFVSRYQKLIQDQQIKMKMHNSRLYVPPCETLLEQVMGAGTTPAIAN